MEEIHIYKNSSGIAYSVCPPETFLTFEYWIYMVPQYKPKSVLILGYAGGTVAGLIQLIWGNVPITAVDQSPREDEGRYEINFIQGDARDFVKTCPEYDAIIIDLFDNETAEPPDFVTDPEFITDLTRVGNYLIINSLNTDMSNYQHLRNIGINRPSGSEVSIYYFETKDKIPNLHPRK